MSPSSFPYRPLDISLHEIRLLTILPGEFSDPISCTIRHVSLPTCPAYEALSYVWGDDQPNSHHHHCDVLQLDGVKVSVTTNLFAALRQLRHSAIGKERVGVWVDALCINQANVSERSQQVSMMRDIYSSAERVVIWLGEAGDGSDEAFDSLHLIADNPPLITAKETNANPKTHDQDRSAVMRRCSSFFFDLTERRPWFRRTWILQELAMAKDDPLVLCGDKSAPWMLLMSAWEAIATESFTEAGLILPESDDRLTLTPSADTLKRPKMKLDILNDLRQAVSREGGVSLRQLLWISKTSLSTDLRDRVYGLLGMIGTKQALSDKSIVVDYQKPVSAVYTDAMAHIISRGEGPFSLSGLHLSGFSMLPRVPRMSLNPLTLTEKLSLPTWVPDFSRQNIQLASQPTGIIFYPPAELGGASGAGADSHNGSILEDNITMRVEGLLVGRIDQVFTLGSSLEECISILPGLEKTIEKTTQTTYTYASPSVLHLMNQWRRSQPLWRILISNKQWNSGYQPAPSVYEDQYRQLFEAGGQDHAGRRDIIDSDRSEYERSLKACLGKKAIFTTDTGFVGTCVLDSAAGDVAAIIFGSPTPFILRPLLPRLVSGQEMPIHALIGASYVGGIMSGEMVDELYCEDLMDSTTFYIQ